MCIILVAAGSALFWFDTGSWLVKPLAQGAARFFLYPMTLEIDDVKGSLHNGYSIEGLKLLSGDEDYFTLDFARVSPDWESVLDGLHGLPFVKDIAVRGIKSDMNKLIAVAEHAAKLAGDKTVDETSKSEPLEFTLKPFRVMIEDVNITTPYANLALDELSLNEAGGLILDAKIISLDKTLPLKANAIVDINKLEIAKSDLVIGKGTGKLAAALNPLDAKLFLTALSLEELMNFAPIEREDFKASGRIDGKFFVQDNNNAITASGVLSMPRASIMDIPLNFRLPFKWDGSENFSLEGASLKTQAASLKLNASANVNSLKIKADGEANNISLNEIGKIFAPEAKLKGEGGNIKFDVDTLINDDVLANTRADIEAAIPSISAAGINILQALEAHAKLAPKTAPKIALNGKIFGGKLFARGEVDSDMKPSAVISIVNLDVPTLLRTFPDAAKAVKNANGKITTRTVIPSNLNIKTNIKSDKLGAYGMAITNLLADVIYDFNHSKAELEHLTLNMGKGLLKASGNVDLKSSVFEFNAHTENFDPKAIPELKDLTGAFNIKAGASGKYTDTKTIKANAEIKATNAGYSGIRLGNLDLPVHFANNVLTIPNARGSLPGGNLAFGGTVNISNAANPTLDIHASTQGVNIAEVLKTFSLQDKSMPISGKVRGGVNVKGALNTATVNANLYVDNFKAGKLVNMPSAALEASGNMSRVTVRKLQAKINNANINGNGSMSINPRNFMKSSLNINANVRNLELKSLLAQFMEKPPVTGEIRGNITVNGTIAQPVAQIKLSEPIYYGIIRVDDIALKLRAPEENHYVINAKLRAKNFKPEVDIDVLQRNNSYVYDVRTKPLDLNNAIEVQTPSMTGIVKGAATVKVNGSVKSDFSSFSPININVSSPLVKVIDKVSINKISLPIVYNISSGKLIMKKGTAVINNGDINSGFELDTKKNSWNGKVNVAHLDFGKLAQPFLPEGEIIGTVDADITAKGTLGTMPTSFANGKFSTSSGHIHKMAVINKVSPTKKITFEKISGSFFWNGRDLFLNPGTGARADKNEPLYRYVAINGAMGIPGKGLNLNFDGRFDLKILDRFLGAMKGVFQYMAGGLAGSTHFLRDAAGRMLGVKRRDFQNVSFRLANSWDNLQFLDLKVTKPIEDFLPINLLNKNDETQRSEQKFKLQLKFPVGPGNHDPEDDSPADQFKQQLIDNLFDMGL